MRFRFHVRQHLLGLGLVSALVAAGCGGSSGAGTVRVTIPAGSSFGAAVDSLARAHIVSSPRLFRFYASSRGRDRALKAGTYVFRRGASWNDVLDARVVMQVVRHRSTDASKPREHVRLPA